MIYLTTGLPGAGKTLFTLYWVRERGKRENRAVYYHGIEILKPEEFPGWTELAEPKDWHNLPDGAIFVHDECQTLYRPRGTGSQVPEHVAKYETHRHQGHDIYLITQHPMLLDSNIRRLVGEHIHVIRPFGGKTASVHKWGQVKDQCDKSRADSERSSQAYPVALYDAYKSATIHTHKRRFPKAYFVIAAVPFILGGVIWGVSNYVKTNYLSTGETVAEQITEAMPSGAMPGRPRERTESGGMTVAEWAQSRTARVPGLAHTAPIYDSVTAPIRAPFPAACVEWAGQGCRCYTEQATRLEMDADMCRQIVQRGYYREFDDGSRSEEGSGYRGQNEQVSRLEEEQGPNTRYGISPGRNYR